MFIPDEYLEHVRKHRSLPADSPPLRLFRSETLEKFTHTPVYVVPLFWLPVAALFAWHGLRAWPAEVAWQWYPLSILLGFALVWTLTEYVMHRLVFHSKPRWRWQEEMMFLIHGIHHVQPHTATRLVVPVTVSAPVGGLFLWGIKGMCELLGIAHLSFPFMTGFILGYVTYDLLHYTLHHVAVQHPWLKRLRRHHMEHHFKDSTTRFGVTSEAWDHVFGTHPVN